MPRKVSRCTYILGTIISGFHVGLNCTTHIDHYGPSAKPTFRFGLDDPTKYVPDITFMTPARESVADDHCWGVLRHGVVVCRGEVESATTSVGGRRSTIIAKHSQSPSIGYT